MKTWLFALAESIIAALGLAAYFWGDSLVLAGAAAAAAGLLGIAQPLLAARREQRMQAYQDRQFDRSLESVDEQLSEMLDQVIEPPFPHRATVEFELQRLDGERFAELLAQYDRVVDATQSGSFAAEELAAALNDKVEPWVITIYLQGIASQRAGNIAEAHQFFTLATQQKPAWISPWLGWATTAYELGKLDEISERHPHVNGVELLPYDCGGEESFLAMSEQERETLTSDYQQAAASLGNFYAIAEFSKSKQTIHESREEYRRAA